MRQTKKISILFLTIVILTIALGLLLRTKSPSPPPTTDAKFDVESYIRAQVTTNNVSDSLQPVAIYYEFVADHKRDFCSVGTLFRDEEHGLQVVTAEHIFRIDIPGDQIFSVKALRGSIKPPIVYLDKVIKRSNDFEDHRDAVVITISTKPTVFTPFSHFVLREFGVNKYGEVQVNGKKIHTFRSLVSGKSFEPVGQSTVEKGTDRFLYMLIDRISLAGESGTGFIDDYGGLWVLHGSPEGEAQVGIVKQCFRVTKKKIRGVSMLSGPFGGTY